MFDDDDFIVMDLEDFQREMAGKPVKPARATRKRKGNGSGQSDKKTAVELLLEQIDKAGLPKPRKEYIFHATRKWRFDLSWKQQLVACEVEGGIWMQTRTGRGKGHAHPIRFEEDCVKYNEAALYGWTLVRVTPAMVRDGRAIDWLKRALITE